VRAQHDDEDKPGHANDPLERCEQVVEGRELGLLHLQRRDFAHFVDLIHVVVYGFV